MESRTKNSIRNIVYGCINKIITIILPFIVRTIMIQILGTEYLGLNSLFTSILQVLNLAELGFGNALVYSMYKPIAENDNKKICELLNYYKKCYKIIGIIVLAIGLLILLSLDKLIAGQHPENINIYYIYIIYLINTVLSYFLFAYKSSLLIANQRNDISSKINLVLMVLQNLIQIIMLLIVKNYYYYIIVLPVITILNNLTISKVVDKRYPQYKSRGSLGKEESKSIRKNVKGMFFQKIGSVVLSNVDNIVISAFLGLNILGLYNNYYYIITSLFGILSVITDSLKASVGNSIILESNEKNYNDFVKFNFLYVWIISWMSICLLCLMENFVELWLGKEYLFESYITVLFAIYFFIHKWCDMLYVYQEAKGLWWENRYIQLTAAIVNLTINLILVNVIGLPGILISTIISVLIIDDIGYAMILFKEYFNKKGEFKRYILNQIKYLIVTIIVALITFNIDSKISNVTIMNFLLKIIICLIVPNLLLLIIYRYSKEFHEAKVFFKETILKIKNKIS